MVRNTLLALAISAGLVGVTGARASAQAIEAGVYVAAPPVYVTVGRPPRRGYVWVPEFRRWEYRPHEYRFFHRERPRFHERRFYDR
jgi:hypothetical protein